jgi:D-alanyl-D-alanine endopeptidase (penicillin-binding protein 7)
MRAILGVALVGLLLVSSPAIAKRQKQPQNKILATSYLVQDLDSGEVLVEKNSSEVRSIASITKLMTAVVVLDAQQDLNEEIDVKPLAGVHSKIVNNTLTRGDLLLLALMSSDNLAVKTLAVHYPGGEDAAIEAMNRKAHDLGMENTHYTDPTGLDETNVSNSKDLTRLLNIAETYPYISYASTHPSTELEVPGKRHPVKLFFHTTNRLVTSIPDIVISKTGWIHQAGGCLIMNIHDQGRRLAVVLLNSRNTHTRLRDGELLYGLQHGKNI